MKSASTATEIEDEPIIHAVNMSHALEGKCDALIRLTGLRSAAMRQVPIFSCAVTPPC